MSSTEYKATFRFPLEQYEYMEVEAHGTAESLVGQFRAFKGLLKVGDGLPEQEWREVMKNYVAGKGMSEPQMSQMNKAQSWWIHEWDKLQTRLAYKANKGYKEVEKGVFLKTNER